MALQQVVDPEADIHSKQRPASAESNQVDRLKVPATIREGVRHPFETAQLPKLIAVSVVDGVESSPNILYGSFCQWCYSGCGSSNK